MTTTDLLHPCTDSQFCCQATLCSNALDLFHQLYVLVFNAKFFSSTNEKEYFSCSLRETYVRQYASFLLVNHYILACCSTCLGKHKNPISWNIYYLHQWKSVWSSVSLVTSLVAVWRRGEFYNTFFLPNASMENPNEENIYSKRNQKYIKP